MKKYLSILILLLFSFCVSAQSGNELPNPMTPPRLVNDFTGHFLTPDQNEALEKKLYTYDDSSSNQIAVVVVDELKGYSIGDYATALGRKWGVGGQKQFSNGIVILINTGEKSDKRGVFIATGYGLEGAVTDIVASQIVQNDLLPNFKAGNNYRGLDLATDDIIKAAAGRYVAPEGYHDSNKGGGIGIFEIVFIVVIFIIILSFLRKGGGNNRGGGYVSRRGYRDDWGGGGMPWIFPGGGGGSSSGGGGWSGGGGGFGGFGGGSFGGGGAGGSW